MVFKKESHELNEEQKKALNELKEKNKRSIKQAEDLLKKYEKSISSFDEEMEKFWEITNRMEKANSHYPFGHYSHYYYRNLEEPNSESFILNFGEKNPNYQPLSKEDKKIIESQLPDYEKYQKIVSENMKAVQDLVKKLTSSNIIVIRLAGISEKYKELKGLDENWWCPQEIAASEYGLRGHYPLYDPQLTAQVPYHRELMIRYDTLHNTANMLRSKLRKIKEILEAINAFIPFAQLLPSDKIPQTYVNVETSTNSSNIGIGNDTEFKGDTSIGKNSSLKK